MQAIITKVIPATNTKPTRIKAYCERGSIVVNPPDSSYLDAKDTHIAVAQMLCDKFAKEDLLEYKSPIAGNPWQRKRVCGGLPGDKGCAHVFADRTG